MNAAAAHTVMAEARHCAAAMLDSATYIRDELPHVEMTDELRERTTQLCSALIGARHDILSELSDLDDLLDSGPPAATVLSRVDRIIRWLREDLTPIHPLVMALKSAAASDPAHRPAHILITESAANILHAFNRTAAAAEALRAEAGQNPSA